MLATALTSDILVELAKMEFRLVNQDGAKNKPVAKGEAQ